jgi:hypothetical protein
MQFKPVENCFYLRGRGGMSTNSPGVKSTQNPLMFLISISNCEMIALFLPKKMLTCESAIFFCLRNRCRCGSSLKLLNELVYVYIVANELNELNRFAKLLFIVIAFSLRVLDSRKFVILLVTRPSAYLTFEQIGKNYLKGISIAMD